MKTDYLKFVQWGAADGLFVGYCPDLLVGDGCRGSDEQKVYRELSPLVVGAVPKKSALVTMPVAV
jgi:hypothetical protein